jgi:hypothetical protein
LGRGPTGLRFLEKTPTDHVARTELREDGLLWAHGRFSPRSLWVLGISSASSITASSAFNMGLDGCRWRPSRLTLTGRVGSRENTLAEAPEERGGHRGVGHVGVPSVPTVRGGAEVPSNHSRSRLLSSSLNRRPASEPSL